ncbi:immune-related, lectin-like receptor 4 [Hypomesus transpacificus]|uniref:immune-related, lectin-like receptor 4 n=1 Tax=Hypomesus transpacificus TaxID=137520 RepID=UPI001F07656C|nr:immune-related, lectin-like receptor 4 [Hypomesus transpacificus]
MSEVLYADVNFQKKEKAKREDDDTSSTCKDTTYAEINFNRDDQNQATNAGNAASQQQVGSKVIPGGRNPVRVALVVLGVLLIGAVITLVVICEWDWKCLINFKDCRSTGNRYSVSIDIETWHYGKKDPQYGPDWKYFGGKCYYFSSDMKNWPESRDACISSGGHLVIIETEEEQDFLIKELGEKIKLDNQEDKFWIGLTDLKEEGTWLWVDNSKLNQNKSFWLKDEPDNWKGPDNKQHDGEDCVRMGELQPISKCWLDKFCSAIQRRICESNTSRTICQSKT